MSRASRVKSAEMLTAAASAGQFPAAGAPEVAFLGRSNVGKSSLLNRLVGRRRLARTSSTPGKTRLLCWYRVERTSGELWFVDLPGYGYAKVSRRERESWRGLVEAYLGGRPSLRVAVLLQDLRRDASEDETLLLEAGVGGGHEGRQAQAHAPRAAPARAEGPDRFARGTCDCHLRDERCRHG